MALTIQYIAYTHFSTFADLMRKYISQFQNRHNMQNPLQNTLKIAKTLQNKAK